MGRKKKLFSAENDVTTEEIVNEDKYSDFVAEDMVDSIDFNKYFSDDIESDYGSAISQYIESEKNTEEVIVPVICKLKDGKVVVDYKGFGIIVDADNITANKITLKIYGEIGKSDFRFEVI